MRCIPGSDRWLGIQIESSTRSTNRSFKKLVTEGKATPELIYKTICNQTVDLVFTAHPTQASPCNSSSSSLTQSTWRLHHVTGLSSVMMLTRPHCCRLPSHTGSLAVQALRQSLLKKYSVVRSDLDSLHNNRMSAYEKAECLESIRAQVQAAWRTDEIRRSKPSPQAGHPMPRRATPYLALHQ